MDCSHYFKTNDTSRTPSKVKRIFQGAAKFLFNVRRRPVPFKKKRIIRMALEQQERFHRNYTCENVKAHLCGCSSKGARELKGLSKWNSTLNDESQIEMFLDL